jgi:DNA-binding transcriptional LysR family regulator
MPKTRSMVIRVPEPCSRVIKVSLLSAYSFVSRVLAQFKQKYPDMTFHLEVTNRKLLLEKLTNHSSDLVIMGEPPADINNGFI